MARVALLVAVFVCVVFRASAGAQATNTVPKWDASTPPVLVSGSITDTAGNVAIGTGGGAKLSVTSTVDTQHPLDLSGLNTGTGLGGVYALVNFLNTDTTANTVTGFRFQHHNAAAAARTSASIESSLSAVTPGAEDGWLAFSTMGAGNPEERMRIDKSGNIGIGVSVPTERLHVAGNLKVDGNIAARFQDVAEWVDARETLPAGTVVSIDEDAVNGVRQSLGSYEMSVAGVVSPQPGLTLGEPSAEKLLIAHTGRVRVKVDASYGAIRAGDLLVTSPVPGFAMRSAPTLSGGVPMHRPGTVLGKALQSLPAGRGEILVLLALQ